MVGWSRHVFRVALGVAAFCSTDPGTVKNDADRSVFFLTGQRVVDARPTLKAAVFVWKPRVVRAPLYGKSSGAGEEIRRRGGEKKKHCFCRACVATSMCAIQNSCAFWRLDSCVSEGRWGFGRLWRAACAHLPFVGVPNF